MVHPEHDDRALQAETKPQGSATAGAAFTSAAVAKVLSAPESFSRRYEVLAELGRGGMGVVYRALDRETNGVVALKVIKPEIANDAAVMSRFTTELLLARKVTHKNVCRSYEFLRFDSLAVMTMEYVPGESLRVILDRFGSVPFRRGLLWAKELCEALAEAHAQGVLHRDLKPENILIDDTGHVKIMDFGIARSIEAHTGTGRIIGTPAYMSPEQTEGHSLDARSDIYSLGLVFYEMFTGKHPFEADTPLSAAFKQVHEIPAEPRTVEPFLPVMLETTILKCLEKEQGKRFQTTTELLDYLRGQEQVRVSDSRDTEDLLPVHLRSWQNRDWLVLSFAFIGLTLFLLSFDHISPASRHKIYFDRSVFRRISADYLQKLDAPIGKELFIGNSVYRNSRSIFEIIGRREGGTAALDSINNPVPYDFWYIQRDLPGSDGRTDIWVNNKGMLLTYIGNFPVAHGDANVSQSESQRLAEDALHTYWSREPSDLDYQSGSEFVLPGVVSKPDRYFSWVDKAANHGLINRYRIAMKGRTITYLESSTELPTGTTWTKPRNWQIPTAVVIGLVLLVVGIRQSTRVACFWSRWRVVTASFGFLVAGLASWSLLGRSLESIMMSIALAGTTGAVALMTGSITLETLYSRLPGLRMWTLQHLVDSSSFPEACGRSIVRGTEFGLLILGVDTGLTWLGITRRWLWPDSFTVVNQFFNASMPLPAMEVTTSGLFETIGTGVVVAMGVAIAIRFLRSRWRVCLISACLLACTGLSMSMAGVQPNLAKIALLFVDFLVLAWVLYEYDVLTMLSAVFTFAFLNMLVPVTVMWQPMGSVPEWITLGMWVSLICLAILISFRSTLRVFQRRAAQSFN